MKRLMILIIALMVPAVMAQGETEDNYDKVASLLTDGASKAMYLTHECDFEIDKEKFREVSKLFVFRDGLKMPENIDWTSISTNAKVQYKSYATEFPNGSKCEKLKEQIEGIAHLLKKHIELNLVEQ